MKTWEGKQERGLGTKSNGSEKADPCVALTPFSRSSSAKATGLQSDLIFEEIGRRLRRVGSQLVKKVDAVFQWDIVNGGTVVAQWTLDLKTGAGEVYHGASRRPANTVFILSDHDFMDLVRGKLKPRQAFLAGKVKVKGSLLLSRKLETILKDCSTL